MKKYLWIVALLTALSLAFIGCPNGGEKEPPEPPEGELVTIWEMATDENIQALEEGLTIPANDDVSIAPLVRAGDDTHVTIETVKVEGKTAIKFTTLANWGAGLDLRYSEFGFQAGDNIKITGEVLSGDGRTQINFSIGAEDAKGSEVTAGAINWDYTLDAATVATISKTSPAGLRIEGRPGEMVVQITNIVITGYRPTNIAKLTAPVIEATESGVSWETVEGANGYKVFAEGIEDPIATLNAEATSVNINGITSLATGDYTITVVALGVTGVSADSDPSNAVVFTKTGVSTIYQVPSGGEDFFFVNLNDYQTQTPASANINSTVPAGVLAADKLTLTFTENNQRANFKLTDYQAGIMSTAESITVTIVGTATPDTSFRYHIGNALTGANWNATSGSGDGAFSTKLTSEQTFTGNRDEEDLATVGYFILQQRAEAETTVEITSIKIEFVGALPPLLYELGEYTVSNNDNQKGWGFNGVDGDHDWDAFVAAKYLVVEANLSNRDGLGGVQLVWQGDGNEYAWVQTQICGDWTSFASAEGESVYLVLQLDALTGYEAFVGGTKGKIFIAMYPLSGLGYQNAFLVGDMDKPSDAVDLIAGDVVHGYITKGE